MDIFKNDDYLYISNFVEDKLPELRKMDKYNKVYLENSTLIEELDSLLQEKEKQKLNEIIKTNYELENYYFAYAFLLGAKYSKKIENL